MSLTGCAHWQNVPGEYESAKDVGMKILRVITSIDPALGGPVEAARRIDEVLLARGHQVELVCLDDPAASYIGSYPAKTIALGPSAGGYGYNARLVPWLKANARDFDAVIVDGLWQYHSFGVWRALSALDVPYFVFTHGMLDPWFKRAYPLKHLKKWLYWPWAEYRVLRDARGVIFTCEDEMLLARQSFWLYHCNELIVTLGTSSPPRFDAALVDSFLSSFPECRQRRLILFLGRIHEKKGCDLLIRAFADQARLEKDIHLVMAGPDQTGWADDLKAMAAEAGVADRITWTGMLAGERKWGAFHAAEIFALPSHQENFGIAVVEALGCGKPVLISNKVNIWREIKADGVGWISEDTAFGCKAALLEWLNTAPEELQAMNDRAMQSFAQRFHIESTVDSLLEVLTHAVRLAPPAVKSGLQEK